MARIMFFTFFQEFGMDKIFRGSDNVKQVSTRAAGSDQGKEHMVLSGNTIRGLELFKRQDQFGPSADQSGTLFKLLNKTRTRFGARKLKDWLSEPLMDPADIKTRQVKKSSAFTKSNFLT